VECLRENKAKMSVNAKNSRKQKFNKSKRNGGKTTFRHSNESHSEVYQFDEIKLTHIESEKCHTVCDFEFPSLLKQLNAAPRNENALRNLAWHHAVGKVFRSLGLAPEEEDLIYWEIQSPSKISGEVSVKNWEEHGHEVRFELQVSEHDVDPGQQHSWVCAFHFKSELKKSVRRDGQEKGFDLFHSEEMRQYGSNRTQSVPMKRKTR